MRTTKNLENFRERKEEKKIQSLQWFEPATFCSIHQTPTSRPPLLSLLAVVIFAYFIATCIIPLPQHSGRSDNPCYTPAPPPGPNSKPNPNPNPDPPPGQPCTLITQLTIIPIPNPDPPTRPACAQDHNRVGIAVHTGSRSDWDCVLVVTCAAKKFNFTASVKHVPGIHTTMADSLSHFQMQISDKKHHQHSVCLRTVPVVLARAVLTTSYRAYLWSIRWRNP